MKLYSLPSWTPLCSGSDVYKLAVVIHDTFVAIAHRVTLVPGTFFPLSISICRYFIKHMIGATETPRSKSFEEMKEDVLLK